MHALMVSVTVVCICMQFQGTMSNVRTNVNYVTMLYLDMIAQHSPRADSGDAVMQG